MYCPSCGQEQIAEETRFCSRCGFPLLGVAEVMNNGGAIPSALPSKKPKGNTPRKKGIKQGLFIFLLTFLVVPIIAVISLAVGAEEPYAVVVSAILLAVGGLLRVAYALLFQDDEPNQTASEQNLLHAAQKYAGKVKSKKALPPEQSIPTTSYIPPKQVNWRDTNDLAQTSVTEGTTKLLQDE